MKYLAPLILLFLFACNTQNNIECSFYHWQTNFNSSEAQNKVLDSLNVKKLYVKYFDVKWVNNAPIPVAEINWKSTLKQTIIPVIYITTDVFSNIDSVNIKQFARQTAEKIKALHQSDLFTEIQIDCDWMPSIKNKYFYFLTEIQTHFTSVIFSSTIRLYQYKYPKIAGVPPVNKGLLMYYNMGELFQESEKNSILNNEIGQQYLGFGTYPLPIDVALPNFSWSLVFRSNEFQYISKDFTELDFKNTNLFEKDTLNKWWIKQDTVINNTYYRYGDHIRFEKCSKQELLKAAQLLTQELNQDNTNVIFYDLNSNLQNDYEKINTVINAFKQ